MSFTSSAALTHRQQVTRLYKAWLRDLQSWDFRPHKFRYNATVLRARFDANKDIKDLIEARKLLRKAEAEYEKHRHYQPFKFPNSPGGIAFGREPEMPDAVMDTWHPLEKAQYPDYFSKRVALKKEYIEWYVQKYGITGFNPEVDGHIHFDGDHGHGHNSHDDHHNDDKHDEEKSKSH